MLTPNPYLPSYLRLGYIPHGHAQDDDPTLAIRGGGKGKGSRQGSASARPRVETPVAPEQAPSPTRTPSLAGS